MSIFTFDEVAVKLSILVCLVLSLACGSSPAPGNVERPELPPDEQNTASDADQTGSTEETAPADSAMPAPDEADIVFVRRPGFVWVEGNWYWTPEGWLWRSGRFQGEREGFVYVQGRYQRSQGRPIWVEGRWVEGRLGHVWQRGYWDDRDGVRVWVPGQWISRRPGHTWERGRWDKRDNRAVWVPGRWRQVGETTSP